MDTVVHYTLCSDTGYSLFEWSSLWVLWLPATAQTHACGLVNWWVQIGHRCECERLSLCVSPATDCRPVQGVPSLLLYDKEAGLGEFLHVCLSVSPDMLWGRDDNRDVRGVQRPRSAANLPGHLARPSSGHS
uniref:Uncharacterized protein n=1 Tax=Pundamilia nyererei TaxID=303518 RepID=A0A3B4H5Z5_9CICH